jgi:hypothetical protein
MMNCNFVNRRTGDKGGESGRSLWKWVGCRTRDLFWSWPGKSVGGRDITIDLGPSTG